MIMLYIDNPFLLINNTLIKIFNTSLYSYNYLLFQNDFASFSLINLEKAMINFDLIEQYVIKVKKKIIKSNIINNNLIRNHYEYEFYKKFYTYYEITYNKDVILIPLSIINYLADFQINDISLGVFCFFLLKIYFTQFLLDLKNKNILNIIVFLNLIQNHKSINHGFIINNTGNIQHFHVKIKFLKFNDFYLQNDNIYSILLYVIQNNSK